MEQKLEILPGYPLEAYLHGPDSAGWDPETRSSYRRALVDLQGFLAAHGPPTPQRMQQWQQALRQRGYSQRSINQRISAANNYFRWCGRFDLLMHHTRPARAAAPALTRAEYLRLLYAARAQGRHRLYLLIKLFATTGVPLQCLDQVTAELVRAGGGMLRQRGGDYCLRCPPALQAELLEYMQENGIAAGPVFVSRSGRVVNRSNLCREMQDLCRAAGVAEGKCSPRALHNLYQTTQNDLSARMEQLLQQAYDQLLQAEQTTAGWKAGA